MRLDKRVLVCNAARPLRAFRRGARLVCARHAWDERLLVAGRNRRGRTVRAWVRAADVERFRHRTMVPTHVLYAFCHDCGWPDPGTCAAFHEAHSKGERERLAARDLLTRSGFPPNAKVARE